MISLIVDTSVNFYVQIMGHKRFLLLPPSAHRSLYLFPRLHYHARRSQVNFHDVDLSKYPLIKEIPKAFEVHIFCHVNCKITPLT